MAHRKLRPDFDAKIAGLYDLEDTIGRGHFAVVKLARHVFTGERVAVKVIDKTKLDEVSKAHLLQEVRCMKLVQHPYVVRLYEVIDTQTKLYLILELGDGGDMYDYIMKHDKGLDEKTAKKYFRQIVEAISYCHKLHVVHRDLKPENVVFFEKLGVVKLTDFGFSNMFNPGKKLETSCGSLAYSAPEILLGDSYDAPAVDIWSLGVILYMLVCGRPPFQEANDSETLTMIMDCKYSIPPFITQECRELISRMLIREPVKRATLWEIERHHWLMSEDLPHPHNIPLISRQHLSDDDHSYVVEKMVEGNICTKDEILQSLEKDSYNHMTATYYLLAERRLRRHRQELMNTATVTQPRKNSAPPVQGKPYLEPLALSPRKQKEFKKTKTAPLWSSSSYELIPELPESPTTEILNPVSVVAGRSQNQNYFKSLTTSMTLDRRTLGKKSKPPSSLPAVKSESPQLEPSKLPLREAPKKLPVIQEPVSVKRPKSKAFSKIAILSSFFEHKAAALVGKGPLAEKKGGLFPLRGFGKKKKAKVKQRGMFGASTLSCNRCEQLTCICVLSKDAEHAEEMKYTMPSFVQSLLSPPGTHPSPATSRTQSPDSLSRRKCSLIHEESLDEEEAEDEADEEEDMDTDIMQDIRMAKSAESLEQLCRKSGTSLTLEDSESAILKRPLLSVASSPQLLNQISEENESEEEDDYVPSKIHSPRMLMGRKSITSPEMIRKYEAKKKRRAGSRGTSCSSSDASDTDDTEGRSRKDKLKQKFAHRRDSSDHSSDTDGGPNGHGGGGGGSQGRRDINGEQGGSEDPKDPPNKDSSDKGSGNGSKGKSGSNHGSQHHNNHTLKQVEHLQPVVNRFSDLSLSSATANRSISSMSSRSSFKYLVDKERSILECEPDETSKSVFNLDELNLKNSQFHRVSTKDFSILSNKATLHINSDEISVCSEDCHLQKGKHCRNGHVRIKIDINSNGFCKAKNNKLVPIKSKCCSLI
ncbi:hypothetical protein CHS0354_029735 [Potamilus streckersoni]|uniref:SNF-related serine/threonine-protein kinase n=1 Tax=Potamilus streckersoni TaxID=2493646 RepID=A0AAE0WEC5_9BIVA|nr:hypothetical protein CHS0354_029735 [Potamilus streckersoni]